MPFYSVLLDCVNIFIFILIYKESRRAYSHAKTTVIYLPDRVASMNREEAFQYIEEVHRELHLAETFEKNLIKKGYLKWFARPEWWILYNYWQIIAVVEVLHNSDWNAMENRHILRDQLHEIVDVVHCYFAKRGINIKKEKWLMKNRFKIKGEIEKRILERVRSFHNDNLKRLPPL